MRVSPRGDARNRWLRSARERLIPGISSTNLNCVCPASSLILELGFLALVSSPFHCVRAMPRYATRSFNRLTDIPEEERVQKSREAIHDINGTMRDKTLETLRARLAVPRYYCPARCSRAKLPGVIVPRDGLTRLTDTISALPSVSVPGNVIIDR